MKNLISFIMALVFFGGPAASVSAKFWSMPNSAKDLKKQIKKKLEQHINIKIPGKDVLVKGLDGALNCLNNCGRWDASATSCIYDTHAIKQGNQCVCDSANHYVQARRDPVTIATSETSSVPRCVKPIEGMKLIVQTGTFEDNGTDAGFIFKSCPIPLWHIGINSETNYEWPEYDVFDISDPDCFTAKFNDSGPLSLNASDYETINFGDNLGGQAIEILPEGRSLTELQYPDDIRHFGILPDVDYYSEDDSVFHCLPFDCDIDYIFDAWLVAGVELQVKLAGEASYKTVYRNPAVNRWIEMTFDLLSYHSFISTHSFDDVALAYYIETADVDNAGTDDQISVRVPLDQTLSRETVIWVQWEAGEYSPDFGGGISGFPRLSSPEGSTVDVLFDWGGYDDFKRNGKTSYGVTIPNSFGKVIPQYQIQTDGEDAVKIARIKAYMFNPGSPDFIDNQKCFFSEVTPNVWLSTDADEGANAWPSGYQDLQETTCPDFNNIQWGSGSDGAFGFGRR